MITRLSLFSTQYFFLVTPVHGTSLLLFISVWSYYNVKIIPNETGETKKLTKGMEDSNSDWLKEKRNFITSRLWCVHNSNFPLLTMLESFPTTFNIHRFYINRLNLKKVRPRWTSLCNLVYVMWKFFRGRLEWLTLIIV